jgi:hypothetical protein
MLEFTKGILSFFCLDFLNLKASFPLFLSKLLGWFCKRLAVCMRRSGYKEDTHKLFCQTQYYGKLIIIGPFSYLKKKPNPKVFPFYSGMKYRENVADDICISPENE